MKKDPTVYLESIEERGGDTSYTYASYLREGWVQRSLVIVLNSSNVIQEMYVNSNDYGSVEWHNGTGLTECHFWEDEEMAKKVSSLSKRYTAILSDGATSTDFALEAIIPDVLYYLPDEKLAHFLSGILSKKSYDNPVDMSSYNNQKALH